MSGWSGRHSTFPIDNEAPAPALEQRDRAAAARRRGLDEPFSAFPSWFMRITCDRCGKATMINEAHSTKHQRTLPLRDFLARMRHDGCGGRAGKVELLTGIDGATSRPVRKIVLRAE